MKAIRSCFSVFFQPLIFVQESTFKFKKINDTKTINKMNKLPLTLIFGIKAIILKR